MKSWPVETGLGSRLASIRDIDVRPDTAELLAGKEDIVFAKLEEQARKAIDEDGADVLILGSTTMHQSATWLASRVEVPVLNPGLVAFRAVRDADRPWPCAISRPPTSRPRPPRTTFWTRLPRSFHRAGLFGSGRSSSSNTTMETEIPAMLRAREAAFPERFTFHSSRMRMRHVVKEELAAMDAQSLRCAAELADARVDVIGYACLVAIMAMGPGYHPHQREQACGDCRAGRQRSARGDERRRACQNALGN